MRSIHFPESNITFENPVNMDGSKRVPTSAYLGSDEIGNQYVNTLWVPNKEDIEAILAGRPIVVCILGNQLPPLSLFTYGPNGNNNR